MPVNCITGSDPTTTRARKRALGVRPSSRAMPYWPTSTAAAPSVIWLALAAVTVPSSGARNTGIICHAVAVKYRADAFVVVQGDGVAVFIRARYRDDFFVPATFACGLRTLVALGGVVVLFLPRYTPLVGDALGAFDLVGDVEAAHQVRVQIVKAGEIALAQCQV